MMLGIGNVGILRCWHARIEYLKAWGNERLGNEEYENLEFQGLVLDQTDI